MTSKTSGFMAMKGAGYYSRATIGAKHVMDNAARLVLDAVDRMQLKDDGSVFRATDMGAADGGTSLALWGQVLSKVRQQAPSRAIEMIYTDLPRNDFSQLFQIVHGLTDTQSYLSDVSGVHVMASATSFHEAIVPAGTLDLGFSATASAPLSLIFFAIVLVPFIVICYHVDRISQPFAAVYCFSNFINSICI